MQQQDGSTLFDEKITVKEIVRDEKFNKVWRIKGSSEYGRFQVELDINIQLFFVKQDEQIVVCITNTMGNDQEDLGFYDPLEADRKNPKYDKYEYVMCGKVFKVGDAKDGQYNVYVSYGGLLMKITAKKEDLKSFKEDKTIFLLMHKA